MNDAVINAPVRARSFLLVGEIAKDLTGHALHDVEKAIAAA